MIGSVQERAALDAALSRLNIACSGKRKELLLKHLHLVIEKNQVLNLTRIEDCIQGITLHIEDSLSVWKEFDSHPGTFCDIGTGGGFPGIPLGIVSGREGVLLDSVQKKARAVQEFIEQLGLSSRLSAKGMRSEEFALQHRSEFDVVLARAVSSLNVVMELAAPLLKMNGHLISLRSSESEENLEDAQGAAEILGLRLVGMRQFPIGDNGEFHRSVFVYERIGEASVRIPRRPGMAVKRPYK